MPDNRRPRGSFVKSAMPARRVLTIILDAYTPGIGDRLMAEGELPALQRLNRRSARFRLDHGRAIVTGLHGEHMSTGLAPEATGRHSAVHFDPERYLVWQEGTSLAPFPARLGARTVVFDPTYFDLARAPAIRGIVDWGAHDAGAPRLSRPTELRDEIAARFGPYPAAGWIYGSPWPSAAKTREMTEALTRAVEKRAEVAAWLLGERLPDWDLAIVTAHELHSVSEAMWHGIDPVHPLHGIATAEPSRAAIRAVYRAIDRLVGRLTEAFPDAATIVWCLHGMGPNNADVPSMLLLAELLCRNQLGFGLLRTRPEWSTAPGGIAMLGEDENWELAMLSAVRREAQAEHFRWTGTADTGAPNGAPWPANRNGAVPALIDWMPAARYCGLWPEMRAFALPSYLDGRVRINLSGRESRGKVSPASYDAACDAVEYLVRRCRDIHTGEPVVASIERCGGPDPAALGPTACDMIVHWRAPTQGFDHPRLGRIGPVPYRRTGGHTGGHGFAYLAGSDLPPGDYGLRSAFDVAPTVFDLLGERPAGGLAGKSLLSAAMTPQAA